ncbi:MAG: DNA polymerase III subunit beta [Aeriscardovia sp.]|nr:DNA polymerase III subunit beta [Aeriscardovia sp.]
MKVEVNSRAFADATEWASRIISARPTVPVLAGIKIRAQEGLLLLSTFNYEQSARYQIDAGVDEEGTIVVQGKLLAEIARMLPTDKTYLVTEGSRLAIKSGKSIFNLQLMNETDYPQLPAIPQPIGSIDGRLFADAVSQAIVAVARSESRPVLTGVRVTLDGGQLVFCATDRFRLTRVTVDWNPVQPNIQASLIIPGSVLKDIASSIDTAQNVVIGYDDVEANLLSFDNAGRVKTSQLIDGEFPNVDRLFADEYPIHAVIEKQSLVDALHRVSLVAEREAPIRMEFTGDAVRLSAGTADESQASEILAADLEGEPLTVAFNPMYLLSGLGAISEKYVRMKMTTAIKAVEFNGQKDKSGEPSLAYRYLLVPMRFIG